MSSARAAGSLGTGEAGRTTSAANNSPAAQATAATVAQPRVRRARLVASKVEPFSVLKLSFALSLCLWVVTVVATAVLCLVLSVMGVFGQVNETLHTLTDSSVTIDPLTLIVGSVIVGAVDVVLVTALATVAALLYNVCADLVGGVEVTLADRE